ncbi:hypothetical protein QQF64_027733 [Cirrhinus molitorella]|uniref:AIG1-type G domain-containing protein n=1 Tax=Cirrhinus molitorella TaxID=172907 RepID=A0ABR3ND96_9TELE
MESTSKKIHTEEQRDQHPIIAGNKYFFYPTGKAFEIIEDDMNKVLKQLSGQQVFNVEECDAILVFCFIVSRTVTDIDGALNKLNAYSASKPAVFMVLHQTFEPEKIVPDSSRYVTRVNTLTVDCFFNEDKGLLKCEKNGEALFKILKWLQPQSWMEQTWTSWIISVLLNVLNYVPSMITQRDTKMFEESSCETDPKDQSELILVLLGMCGPEKAAVEHMILGREESQADTSSATQMKITVDTEVVYGEKVFVINTPDCGLSTEKIQQQIQSCIRLSSHGPYAFLLVIPAKPFSEEERNIAKKMEMIFEERCQEKVMILFTVTDEQQKQNIQDHDFQALVKKCGNQFHVLNISETGSKSQVLELLKIVQEIQSNNEYSEPFVYI